MIRIASSNIISPLGITTEENFTAVLNNQSGLMPVEASENLPFKHCTSHFMDDIICKRGMTKLETLMHRSISGALEHLSISGDCALFICTTKGNIDELSKANPSRLRLHEMAEQVATGLGLMTPIVISQACISGVAGIVTAKRWIESGHCNHAIICGGDVISDFVLSGFQSLRAMSEGRCKPYDKNRNGINLGEAVATLVLTNQFGRGIEVGDGAITNDANHISGPSRTAGGMTAAIDSVLEGEEKPGFISAHGTATLFNDEMEAIALERMNLLQIPIHSLKGYFGHTLGAAGLVETIIAAEALDNNWLIASPGFKEQGTTHKINVIQEHVRNEMTSCLKIASGFGGCNAALMLKKQI